MPAPARRGTSAVGAPHINNNHDNDLIDGRGDAYELTSPATPSAALAAVQHRNIGNSAEASMDEDMGVKEAGKPEQDDNDSTLDEDFANETFRMRTAPRSSLDGIPLSAVRTVGGGTHRESQDDLFSDEDKDEAEYDTSDEADQNDQDEEDDEHDQDAPLVGGSRQRRRRKRGSHRARQSARAEANSLDDPMTLVRRVVPETDDPTMPTLTFRVVLIGTCFCVLGAGISQLFFYKSNSPSFSSYFVILVSLPLARWMARVMPKRRVRILRWSFDLNPGPFSIKEHLLIAVVSSSGAVSAYASDIINVQELYFNQHMGILASLTLLITTQTLGFGFAGLMQNLLVKPVAMIFPGSLVTCTMFNTLHAQRNVDTRARLQFFAMVFLAIFLYQFLPSLFMPTLSSMALLCFIDNRNKTFRVLSSGYKGFGLPNISLDWNAISTSGPLYQPWWAALNLYAGLAGAMYVVMPILYYFNFWDAQAFPSAIDSRLYEGKTFGKFDVASLLRPDHTFDREKFEEQKPMLLTPWFAIAYGLSFAVLTAMISHVILWHSKDVIKAMRYVQHDDVHNRLMRAYEPVPRSWYVTTLVCSLGAAVILVASSPLQLPVWGLFLAVGIALLFLVPVGITKAVSDTSIGLNVITEFVAGVLMPGKPIANVCFKCYGYMAMAQALDLTSDLKLGHYMKIPPRDMFAAQMLGTIIGCCVNLFVVRIVLDPAAGYRGYLDGSQIDPTQQWDGRKVRIFYSASIIWGAIGPIEFFSGKYRSLFWFFLYGAIAPVIPWMINKRWPRPYWKLVHFPVLLHGAGLPPQTPTNIIITGFAAAWSSQWWARHRRPKWFARRNYVLASALDAGASVNALCIFLLTISVLKWHPLGHWWMNPAVDSEHCTPTTPDGAISAN